MDAMIMRYEQKGNAARKGGFPFIYYGLADSNKS